MKKPVKIYSRKSLPAVVKPSYYKSASMKDIYKLLEEVERRYGGALQELADI